MDSLNRDWKEPQEGRHFIVGISGASGVLYAVRLVEALLEDPLRRVHLTISPAGQRVLNEEMTPVRSESSGGEKGPAGRRSKRNFFNISPEQEERLQLYACGDIGARPASGTFRAEAMIIVPCSMNTLGSVAHGLQTNLLTRAAGVTLKEGRPLILVPRETPLGLVDLRNMVAVAEAGAIVLPANPGFYHDPTSIDDLVEFVVQKIMDRLGLEVAGAFRWEGSER